MTQYEEPTANITEFLRETLKIDKVKFLKEFINTSNEYDFKFEPTTADLPEEICYQCPIINACTYYNAVKCFEMLADAGAKMSATDSWLCGIVHMAARCGRLNILQNPRCESLNFSSPDWRGRLPTHYAAERSHLDVLRFLIETKGADINAKDKFGMTPLHVACEHCNLDIVTYLLEHGAEMSYDNLGRSPADVAAEKGQVDVLRNFATKNPTLLTTPNNNNQTVVHFAAMSNFNEEIEFLTTIPDIDFNKVDNFGMAPLHYAAEHNNVNAITSLLAVSGINKTIETKPQGNTPLHVAAIYGQEEAATVLISPNIDLNNAVNSDQQSPLHLAACNGHYKTVCSLMKSGLDANLIDKNGRSPREAAKGTYSKQIVSALNGKQVNVGNPCEPEPYKSNTVAPEATAQTQSQGGGCNIA